MSMPVVIAYVALSAVISAYVLSSVAYYLYASVKGDVKTRSTNLAVRAVPLMPVFAASSYLEVICAFPNGLSAVTVFVPTL